MRMSENTSMWELARASNSAFIKRQFNTLLRAYAAVLQPGHEVFFFVGVGVFFL